MKLIEFEGLNCYTNSMCTIARELGAGYESAFGNVWSETAFELPKEGVALLSPRFEGNMRELGLEIEELDCSYPTDTERSLSPISNGEPLLVGMDGFHIPWSPRFRKFSGTHYFAVRFFWEKPILCFDPTYGCAGYAMDLSYFVDHASSLKRFALPFPKELSFDDLAEIQAVSESSLQASETLSSLVEKCRAGKTADAFAALKYVGALIDNRYLYRRYLERRSSQLLSRLPLSDESFFQQWIAVKNGLAKACVSSKRGPILDAAFMIAVEALEKERDAAAKTAAAP